LDWRARRLAAGALAAAALSLAACGERDEPAGTAAAAVEGVGRVRANSTAQFASCRDWNDGSQDARYATITDIRGQLTPQSSETAESPMSDDEAYALFENACSTGYSDDFRLYKLYARAQNFAPLKEALDGG
jgi:hypothetical protein